MRSCAALVLVFRLVLLSWGTPLAAQVVNPDNGHTYFLSEQHLDLFQARDLAATVGGYVASITSEEECEWVVDNLLFTGIAWIGLSDEVDEGIFLWDSGEPFVYENWYPQSPGGGPEENHVVMRFDGWGDQNAFVEGGRRAIIEVPEILGAPVTELVAAPLDASVELSWQNPTSFTAIDIYRDGSLIAGLPGDAVSYLDGGLPSGGYYYTVVGHDGVVPSVPASTFGATEDATAVFRIADASALSGSIAEVGVILDNFGTGPDELVQGWQIGISHDPGQLEVIDVEVGDVLPPMGDGDGPDFFVFQLFPDAVTIALVIELLGPGELITGPNHQLHRVFYEVLATGPLTAPLTFADGLGDPPGMNALITAGPEDIAPLLVHGAVLILPVFLRGDVDSDGVVDALVDGIALLEYGFLGGPAPTCEDASDVDDDGFINVIADAIALFNFGFLTGVPPPAPFPDCGGDGTADALGCESAACP